LQPEGRLHLVLKDLRPTDQPDQSLPTSHQETQLKSFLKKYVEALTENINACFQESSPVLDSFKIFDLLSVPAKTDDGFRYCLVLVLSIFLQIKLSGVLCVFNFCFCDFFKVNMAPT